MIIKTKQHYQMHLWASVRKHCCTPFLITFLCLTAISLNGQESVEIIEEEPAKTSVAIGLSAGSFGTPSGDISFRLAAIPKITFKVNFGYFDYSILNFTYAPSQFAQYEELVKLIDLDLFFRQTNISLFGEYRLFPNFLKGKISLSLVAGCGYFFNNDISIMGQAAENIPFGDIELTPEEIGTGHGTVSFKSRFSPYIGASLGKAIPKKRLGISVDIGTFYKGRPQIDLEFTNLLRHNDENEQIIEDGVSSYRWWPVISFRVAYRIF